MSTTAEPHRQPSSDPAAELAGTRFERFLLRWLIDHGISGFLHGTIFVLGILLVLGAHPPSHLRIILLVALTAFAAALADGYSELTELQIRTFGFLDAVESAQFYERMGSVLVSAVLPIVIFSLSRTGFFEVPTAFNLLRRRVWHFSVLVAICRVGSSAWASSAGSLERLLGSSLAPQSSGSRRWCISHGDVAHGRPCVARESL